jgi:hypothetical protein
MGAISTLTRTFYEASAAEEEGQRRRRGRGDNTEDGAEPMREGTDASALDDAAIDVRWPLSSLRMRPATLL